jgi:hypothetical protein
VRTKQRPFDVRHLVAKPDDMRVSERAACSRIEPAAIAADEIGCG